MKKDKMMLVIEELKKELKREREFNVALYDEIQVLKSNSPMSFYQKKIREATTRINELEASNIVFKKRLNEANIVLYELREKSCKEQ